MASINHVETHAMLVMELEHALGHEVSIKSSYLTAEELYYFKKVVEYRANKDGKKNVFMLVLKNKALAWIKNHKLRPELPFERLARYWQSEFYEMTGAYDG